MSSDPIADMLTAIRNAGASRKKEIIVPASKIKTEILKILKDKLFIEDYQQEENSLKIRLKYYGKQFGILKLKRLSKPGVRRYRNVRSLRPTASDNGFVIVSTSYGVMTDVEARKKKVGGEIICKIE